jgi:hypothetical protein
MKRRHEEFSRNSLSIWLDSRIPTKSATWREVELSDEPPDWYLEIGPNRYAVEATSVVDYLWEFDPPLPSFSVSSSLASFVDRVEKEAKSKGPLNGAYLVSLAPIPNLRDHEEWLFDELMSYIDRTRDQASADEYELGKLGFSTLFISKFESDREYVAEAVSFGAKFEGQALDDLHNVLSSIFEKKSILLRNLREPVILLLLDAFHYSHIVDWLRVVSEMSVPSLFDAIFRTHAEESAQLLYSRSEYWKNLEMVY